MSKEINNFYDLDAWQKAHELTLEVYRLTEELPKEEKYGITSQLRRAASSIAANIAEDFARYHFKDKERFYYQARGSVAEVQNFLLLAKDLDFVSREDCEKLGERANQVRQLINGLVKSIESHS